MTNNLEPKIKLRITAIYTYEVNRRDYENWGLGPNPTNEEILEVEQDQMYQIIVEELTAGDEAKVTIEVVDND